MLRVEGEVHTDVERLVACGALEMVDTKTAEVLNVAYRRSDLIETIHDGSFFSDEVKLYLFLPSGVLLIIMWGTGIYLFLLPRMRKRKKRTST